MNTAEFVDTVIAHFRKNGRQLPWREPAANGEFNPYKIMVSELMLQQTQVSRVIPKYQQFISAYPTCHDLARAPLSEILVLWQGLGYNRRAKFLHQAAQSIHSDFDGKFPDSIEQLVKLPGIGQNTAGAIMAYAFNKPVVFIETNIRAVYIHSFFSNQADVNDSALIEHIAATLAQAKKQITVREWYWALMDYGVCIKSLHANPARRSKHHVVQTKFAGSQRELRGKILRALTSDNQKYNQIVTYVDSDPRLDDVLLQLANEGLVYQQGTTYHLGDGILTE